MPHRRLDQLHAIAGMKRDIALGRLAGLIAARDGLIRERERLQDIARQAAHDGQASLPNAGAAALFACLTEERDGQIALSQARLDVEIARNKVLAAAALGRASVFGKLAIGEGANGKPPSSAGKRQG